MDLWVWKSAIFTSVSMNKPPWILSSLAAFCPLNLLTLFLPPDLPHNKASKHENESEADVKNKLLRKMLLFPHYFIKSLKIHLKIAPHLGIHMLSHYHFCLLCLLLGRFLFPLQLAQQGTVRFWQLVQVGQVDFTEAEADSSGGQHFWELSRDLLQFVQ